MAYLATELIDKSIKKTKELLLPFDFILWLKLAILGIFAGSGGGFNSGLNVDDINPDLFFQHWQYILAAAAGLAFLGLIFLFLSSVFHFCFLESIHRKKAMIFGYFGKHLKKGLSLFFLKVFIGIIFLCIFALIGLPFLTEFFSGEGIELADFNIAYLVVALIFLFFLIIAGIMTGILINLFLVYYMYIYDKKAWASLKRVIALLKQKPGQMIIFWLMNVLLSLLTGIIMIMIFLVIGLIFAMITGAIALIGYLIYTLSSALLVPLIIMGVILGALLLMGFIISIMIASVPFVSFFNYYRLDFMKNLCRNKRL